MSNVAPFFIDRSGTAESIDSAAWNAKEKDSAYISDKPNDNIGSESAKKRPRQRTAAWVDEDDAKDEVNIVERRRTRKFRKQMGERNISTADYANRIRDFYVEKVATKTGGTGDWARLPSESKNSDESGSESEQDSEDDGLSENVKRLLQKSGKIMSKRTRRSAQALVSKKNNVLAAGSLGIIRMQNVNAEAPNKSIANNVEFHPSGKLVLTAGLDRTLRIFQVDGRHNAKIQGVKVKDLQISSAHFTGGGDSVVLSGEQRHLYKFDLNSGTISRLRGLSRDGKPPRGAKVANDVRNQFVTTKDGSILAFLTDNGRVTLVADKTMQQIGHIHVPGQLTSAAFDPVNNNYFYTTTRTGIVHFWDARKMECVDQHRDEGTVHCTSISVSPHHYAVGSDTGIVNVYEKKGLGNASRNEFGSIRTGAPKKAIDNLTTSVFQTAFNHDGKILAMLRVQ